MTTPFSIHDYNYEEKNPADVYKINWMKKFNKNQ
jgi:hypothetical protein